LMYQLIGDMGRAGSWMRYYLDHAVAPDPEANEIYRRLIAGSH
jgi:hypothetical protein